MNNAESNQNLEQIDVKSTNTDAAKKGAEQLAQFLLSSSKVASTPDGITAPPQGITAPPEGLTAPPLGIDGERQMKNVTEIASLLGKFAPEAAQKHAGELQSVLDQIA